MSPGRPQGYFQSSVGHFKSIFITQRILLLLYEFCLFIILSLFMKQKVVGTWPQVPFSDLIFWLLK